MSLSAEDPTVTIKVSHSEYTIPIRLISSVVSQGHTVEINLVDGKCILSNMKFHEIEQIFLEYENFLLCNRGIIVNMFQISSQEKGVFIMKNGARYPIRVNGQSKVKAEFSKFLIKNMRAKFILNSVFIMIPYTVLFFILYIMLVNASPGRKLFCFFNSIMLCTFCPLYTVFLMAPLEAENVKYGKLQGFSRFSQA